MTNPQEAPTKMVAGDSPDKTQMVQPPPPHHMGNAPHRWKAKLIKQMASHTVHPGDLPPVTKEMTRIFTMRAISDGLQTYPEYAILDLEPDFAKQCCEDVFKGQFSHTGEKLEKNAGHHEIIRAVYIEEYLATFVRARGSKS